MQRRPYKSENMETALICTNRKCDNISSKLRLVEDKILDALRDWLKEYNLKIDEYISQVDQDRLKMEQETLKRIENELSKQEKKLSNVYDLFEEGTYTKDIFNQRLLIIDSKIKEIRENKKKQEEKVAIEYKRLQDKKEIVPRIKNIIDLYPKLETAEEKNLLLKTVLKKVLYKKEERTLGKNSDPTNFQLDIYPNVYHAS